MEESPWDEPHIRDLLKVLLMVEGEEEGKAFFRDLLTSKELHELGLRWKVAQMLDNGDPYTQIEKDTGLSSTTIARISKWLSSGAGGYKRMLEKWEKENSLSRDEEG